MLETNIIKIPGRHENLEIRCPKCNSDNVLISLDSDGFYKVIKCKNCDYKSKELEF